MNIDVPPKRVVQIALSYKLRALYAETRWPELKEYEELLGRGEKIPGSMRIVQDAFAGVCSDLRVGNYQDLREEFFSDWKDWNSIGSKAK